MSAVDPHTAATQARATSPNASAWVSANAGSGKTFVLSRRVIRLLLAGVNPARILCLTFTKAAAAEMAKRVFAELGRWTTLTDTELAAGLRDLEGSDPSAATMARARRLFASALDTPGGLKVQTIHAFCERLLHQFPFEANVAGHFEVLDERDERALSVEARRAVLARATADSPGPLGPALQTVLAATSDRVHEDSVAEFVDKRDRLGAWIIANGGLDEAIADLAEALRLTEGESVAGLRARVIDAALDPETARRLLAALESGSTNDVRAGARLRPFVTSDDREKQIDAYLDYFLGDKGEARGLQYLATAGTRWTGLDAVLEAERDRLPPLLDRLRTAELFETTVAMLRIADAAIDEYDRLKRARGVLDFEDLVVKTVSLLSRADASAWVHYKLDRGLDHILVDEAQDTSPRQWQVIRRLAEEFFAGEGASGGLRTLFAVGDEKQSIFSFQGAVPAWFSATQQAVGTIATAGNYLWENLELHLSFRSAPVVLEAVDAVFSDPRTHAGLSAVPRPTAHQAHRHNEPGRVILWPSVKKPPKVETEDWTKPVDHLGQDSPEVTVARRIAATVADWLARGELLDARDKDGHPRPIRPGGILVLVRSRGALTDAIIRELKRKQVPIAGADRLTLTEHIAVMDLMALGRVALLPEDDLSLAALLKSPLVGLDEDALYALAYGREGTLWDALWGRWAERPDFKRAADRIAAWRSLADWRDPHAFFARILGPDGGRKAFRRRLGAEADDVLDEFLAQALAFERTNVPTLEGFLAWLEDGDAEIKRDTDTLRDEVRVMTVHGAKGLEADVVFLVDNGTAPHAGGLHDPRLLSLGAEDEPDMPGPFVWNRSVSMLPQAERATLEAWRERSREEYRRLLYVGMTRARDRLVICGIDKQNTEAAKDQRWHALVTRALEPELTPIAAVDGADAFEWRAITRPPAALPDAASPDTATTVLPPWATRPASTPPAKMVRLSPSRIGDDDEAVPVGRDGAVAADAKGALARGRVIHRLLQSLPDVDPGRRQDAGARYLAAFADEIDVAEQRLLLAEAIAVIEAPDFAAAFAPGSRAEVEVVGRIAMATGEATIVGRIDRLAVTADEVLVVDYKTNRPAPKTVADTPPQYVRQLAAYRLLLRRIYPGKNVAAALLWTDRPALMRIPAEVLDRAEQGFARG